MNLDKKGKAVADKICDLFKIGDGGKQFIWEFFKYCIVGGLAFLADAGSMIFVREVVFSGVRTDFNYYLATAIAFMVGITVNYLLSRLFVFTTEKQKEQSRSIKSFIIYNAVGIIGFFLTMFGMWAGKMIVGDTGFWYVLVKCIVAGLVLIWNYAGRKIFIYKED